MLRAFFFPPMGLFFKAVLIKIIPEVHVGDVCQLTLGKIIMELGKVLMYSVQDHTSNNNSSINDQSDRPSPSEFLLMKAVGS